MTEILNDLKDDLIPLSNQNAVESDLFINETNPTLDLNGEYIADVAWDWSQFYKYLCLAGLQNSAAFHLEIGDPTNNNSPEYQNYISYINTGINGFNINCNN